MPEHTWARENFSCISPPMPIRIHELFRRPNLFHKSMIHCHLKIWVILQCCSRNLAIILRATPSAIYLGQVYSTTATYSNVNNYLSVDFKPVSLWRNYFFISVPLVTQVILWKIQGKNFYFSFYSPLVHRLTSHHAASRAVQSS